eukprot:8852038-Alexandrium_andersonii.AAC.1
MSASLVGSEMCIRDSALASGDASGYASTRIFTMARCPKGRARGGHSNGPVSYTHLTLPTICSV